jgi:hypothetical protein
MAFMVLPERLRSENFCGSAPVDGKESPVVDGILIPMSPSLSSASPPPFVTLLSDSDRKLSSSGLVSGSGSGTGASCFLAFLCFSLDLDLSASDVPSGIGAVPCFRFRFFVCNSGEAIVLGIPCGRVSCNNREKFGC